VDYALRLPERDEWQADEIWQLRNADELDWECPDCNYVLRPVAWRPNENYAVRAHFRAPESHGANCNADGFEEVFGKAGTQTIEDERGVSDVIPSVVTFPEARDVVEGPVSTGEGDRVKKQYISDPVKPPNQNDGKPRRRWAKTLYRICLVHARATPQARKRSSLQVAGCEGRSYFDVFEPLRDVAQEDPAPLLAEKIFFGSIKFKQDIDYNNVDGPTIELLVGRRQSMSFAKRPPYRIRVEWRGWRSEQRRLLCKRLEQKRQALSADYTDAVRTGAPKPSATLYFIGEQDSEDPFLFRVTDSRKIELVYIF
jgi:hypothetical protein